MKRNTLVTVIRYTSLFILKCQPSELVLSAGSAMVMHGLRETTADADVTCTQAIWDLAATNERFHRHVTGYGNICTLHLHAGDVDLHAGDPNIPNPTTTVIDGITVYDLPTLLRQKQLLNRSKDQPDIAALIAAIG